DLAAAVAAGVGGGGGRHADDRPRDRPWREAAHREAEVDAVDGLVEEPQEGRGSEVRRLACRAAVRVGVGGRREADAAAADRDRDGGAPDRAGRVADRGHDAVRAGRQRAGAEGAAGADDAVQARDPGEVGRDVARLVDRAAREGDRAADRDLRAGGRGGALPTPIVIVLVEVRLSLSVTAAVMTWRPAARRAAVTVAPVPSEPATFDDQRIVFDRSPSLKSSAVPLKVTDPEVEKPSAG